MIYYCIISGILNSLASIVLGLAVIARRRPGGPADYFVLFIISGGLWSAAYSGWLLAPGTEMALLWTRMLSAAAIVVPAAYFHFVSRLLDEGPSRLVPLGYGVSFCFSLLSFTPWIVREVAPLGGFPHWPRAGLLYPLYLVFFFAYPTMSWLKLYRALRGSAHARRNQLKFVLLGTTIGFLGGATNFPYWYEIPVPPAGNGLILLYMVTVGYAVVGLRLLEVNYVIIKVTVYVAVALVLSALHAGLIVAVLRFTPDLHARLLAIWLVSLPVVFVTLSTIPALRHRLDRLLERTLLKPYMRGRDALSALARRIASLSSDKEMFEQTVETISQALHAPSIFYIREAVDANYRMVASSRVRDGSALPGQVPADSPLVQALRHQSHPVLLDEIVPVGDTEPEALTSLRRGLRLEAMVPMHADGVLFGFLALGARERNHIYSEGHLSLLDSICLQICMHVRARHVERRANQAEKLISLGTLAAGLAHELRNPLVSIKTFSQLLGENADDPEFRKEFSATVLRDVGRIESIVENVAAFATDRRSQFAWIRLEEVVRAAYAIARDSIEAAGVTCEFDFEAVPEVRANHDQLSHVVLNLLNNAVQAFKSTSDPRITLRLRHRTGDPAHPLAELAVADNGPGIDQDIVPRLFEPFTTTKATGDRNRSAGMGLGLAIVKRIVEGHGGLVRVETRTGAGTTFTILLPCEALAR